jgi:hypothetical protein
MRELLAVLLALPLLTLASYRVWRLIALDTITEPIRARFIFREGRGWEWVSTLVTCPWCAGFWISGAASLGWLLAFGLPLGWLALLWPAVSALVGMLDWLDPGAGD